MKIEIVEVPATDYAFPANVIGKFLPPMDEIPKEFKGSKECNYWGDLTAKLFYGDSRNKDLQLYPKDGIVPEKAYRMISACLRSFQPKHEHKMLGVSFLLHSFFEKYDYKETADEGVST